MNKKQFRRYVKATWPYESIGSYVTWPLACMAKANIHTDYRPWKLFWCEDTERIKYGEIRIHGSAKNRDIDVVYYGMDAIWAFESDTEAQVFNELGLEILLESND